MLIQTFDEHFKVQAFIFKSQQYEKSILSKTDFA